MSQVLPHREVARNFCCECEVQGLQFFGDYKDQLRRRLFQTARLREAPSFEVFDRKWIETGDACAELGRGEFGDISLAKLALVERTSGRRRRLVLRASKTGDGRDTAASRLSRTFATLVETLRRLRSGGSQVIRIERVDVRDGGQAVIGNVKSDKLYG